MYSTELRREHIHGLMIGVAVGDALGCGRQGLTRRAALRKYGRGPIGYQLLPGVGLPGTNTALMIMGAQALVASGVTSENFVKNYQQRLGWYLFSFPLGLRSPTLLAGLRSWLRFLGSPSGVDSAGNEPATRAIFCALALNRAGPRLRRWVEQSTRITHTHPLANDGCQILAGLADLIIEKLDSLEPLAACQRLIALSQQPEMKERLIELPRFIEQGRGPYAVARHFGWPNGISPSIVPTAVMACYCFLRYPNDFRQAVESAIRLGGDTRTMGAVVGGLSGAYLGLGGIPGELSNHISDFAYGPTWISRMVRRLSHWPHGVNDLYSPPGEPAAPLELATVNLLRFPLTLANHLRNLPCSLATRVPSHRGV